MKTQDLSLSWYDVPAEVKQLLIAAADSWEDTERSQAYIQQAIVDPDVPLDVLVAAYRYFFYKHNDPLALQIAHRVVQRIRDAESLPEDWAQLQPILVSRRDDEAIRLYINAYAAMGLVLGRLGALDEAKEITERVSAIDSRRESCAATVLNVLTHAGDEDEDEDES
jgi:tetratricopeptide (TPR) repeat protein